MQTVRFAAGSARLLGYGHRQRRFGERATMRADTVVFGCCGVWWSAAAEWRASAIDVGNRTTWRIIRSVLRALHLRQEAEPARRPSQDLGGAQVIESDLEGQPHLYVVRSPRRRCGR